MLNLFFVLFKFYVVFFKGEHDIPINTTVEELVKIIEELARIH